VVRAKVSLALATAVAAGDALTANWVGWANAPGTRVLVFIEATLVAADDPLGAGAAELVTTVIRKALSGTACVAAQVLTVGARLSRRTSRGGPEERTREQGAPGGAPGP
jgi:hypothetical protein